MAARTSIMVESEHSLTTGITSGFSVSDQVLTHTKLPTNLDTRTWERSSPFLGILFSGADRKQGADNLFPLDLILEALRKEKGRGDFFSLHQSPELLLILNSP